MDARSTYDESNEVWPFFLLTILGLGLLPVTAKELFKLVRGQPKRKTYRREHAQFLSRTAKNQFLHSWTFWVLVAGWAAVAALIHLARSAEKNSSQAAPDIWDPYEILKIARSATPREIRSAYRKLSLEFHPDKVKDTADQAKEQIEAVYVEISKAYRALTDEVTRENFLQFGHPDGPQPVTHGIALPAFLFNPAFAVSFVGLYLLGFGVIIPYFVGKRAVRTRRGLLLDTASQFTELLAKEQPHFITSETVIDIVLNSADMDYALREHGGSGGLPDSAERLKLLRSYLDRSEPQSHLELVIATTTSRLLIALHDMAAVFQAYLLCQRVLELRRAVLQAVPFSHLSDGEYLQLKGASVHDLDDKTGKSRASVREAARSYLPRLELLSAEFNVVGETKVTTLSQAHLTIKFLVLPLGDKPPKLSASEIAAGADFTNLKHGFKSPAAHNATQPSLPEAVTPYYPEEVQTAWYIYLFAGPGCKLAEAPLEVTHMDLHNLKLSREQVEKGDDVVIGTLILPLSSVTPPQPETIPYRMAVSSATYFGTDMKASVLMDVKRPDDTLKREAAADLEDEDEDDAKASQEDDSDEEEVDGPSDIDTSTEEEDNADDD